MSKFDVNKIAEEIVSVQPMDTNIIKNLCKNSLTPKQLEEQGYKPVSGMGLMYVKDNKNAN